MKKTARCAIILFLTAWTGTAAEKALSGPETVVKNTAGQMMAVLQDESLESNAKRKKIMALISPIFDFSVMARQTLGESWTQLKKEQQDEFVSLFKQTLLNAYYKSAELVSDKEVSIVQTRPIVSTEIAGSKKILAMWTTAAIAEGPSSPEIIVEDTAQQVMAVLQDESLESNAKRKKIMALISPIFDFSVMARQTLGESWTQLKKEQQDEFVSLFKQTLLNTYYKSAELVSDEEVSIVQAQAIVSTEIVGPEKTTKIQYLLHKNDTGWKVCNVVIDGVNVVRARSKSYKEQLQSLSPTEFLDKMRKRLTDE